jgi:hypothetical protein
MDVALPRSVGRYDQRALWGGVEREPGQPGPSRGPTQIVVWQHRRPAAAGS